jgi:hypothetical protein
MLDQLNSQTRIDSACFVDGSEDQFIIEFWDIGGSILRTQYNRRTTSTAYEFIAVRSWEYAELKKMSDSSQKV